MTHLKSQLWGPIKLHYVKPFLLHITLEDLTFHVSISFTVKKKVAKICGMNRMEIEIEKNELHSGRILKIGFLAFAEFFLVCVV